MRNWRITFSNGMPIVVQATCEQAARNIAYRVERVFAISSIVEAR